MSHFFDFSTYDPIEPGLAHDHHNPLPASEAAANARLDEVCALASEPIPDLRSSRSSIAENNRDGSPIESVTATDSSLATPSSVSGDSAPPSKRPATLPQVRSGMTYQSVVPTILSHLFPSFPNPLAGIYGPSWSSVPPNSPFSSPIPDDSVPRMLFGSMNTKTRVETQLEFPIILCPAPTSLTRLQLPRSAVSKPKFFGKPETPSPALLHLYTYVVCTSAMENTFYRRCALLKARGETTMPQPTASEKQLLSSEQSRRNREDPTNLDLPQNGGPVRICTGCIQRERKRATRTKKPQTELSKEWDSYEHNRIIVFNMPEYQDWKPIDRDDDELAKLPLSARCVKITMRIACYCRHHNEKKGFQVIFTLKDHNGSVVAQGITPSILTTDDHKTNNANSQGAIVQRSPLQISNIQPSVDRKALYGEIDLASFSSRPTSIVPNITPSASTSSTEQTYSKPVPAPSLPVDIPVQEIHDTKWEGPLLSENSQNNSPILVEPTFSPTDLGQLSEMFDPNSMLQPPTVLSPPASDMLVSRGSGKKRKREDVENSGLPTSSAMLDISSTIPPTLGTMPAVYPSPPANLRFSPSSVFSSPNFNFGFESITPPEFSQASSFVSPQAQATLPDAAMADVLLPITSTNSFTLNSGLATTMGFPPFQTGALTLPQQASLAQNSHRIPLFTNQTMFPAAPVSPARPVRPVITHIIPSECGMSGGIDVACIGSNFSSRISIYIGEERVIFRKDAIAASNIVFVAPPGKVPGTVPVTVVLPNETLEQALQAYEGNDTRVKFTYVEDIENSVLEQAIRILCNQSGGSADHRAYAKSIVESYQRNGGGSSSSAGNGNFNGYARNNKSTGGVESLILSYLDMMVSERDDDSGHEGLVAALDTPTRTGSTLLALTAGANYAQAVEGLLDLGVDVDSRDKTGFTPLMLAALRGHCEIVSALLDYRADPFLRNMAGKTAFDLASSAKVKDCLSKWARREPRGLHQSPMLLDGAVKETSTESSACLDPSSKNVSDSQAVEDKEVPVFDSNEEESVVLGRDMDSGSDTSSTSMYTMVALRIRRFFDSSAQVTSREPAQALAKEEGVVPQQDISARQPSESPPPYSYALAEADVSRGPDEKARESSHTSQSKLVRSSSEIYQPRVLTVHRRAETVQIQGSKGNLTAEEQETLRSTHDKIASNRSSDWTLFLFWIPLFLVAVYFTFFYSSSRLSVFSMKQNAAALAGDVQEYIVRMWQTYVADLGNLSAQLTMPSAGVEAGVA